MLSGIYRIDFGRIGAHIRAILLAPRFQRIEVDLWEFSKNVEIFDIFRHPKVNFPVPKSHPVCLVYPQKHSQIVRKIQEMLSGTYIIDFGRIGAHIRATLLAQRFQRIEVDFWEFSKNVEIFDIFRDPKVNFPVSKSHPVCPVYPQKHSQIV